MRVADRMRSIEGRNYGADDANEQRFLDWPFQISHRSNAHGHDVPRVIDGIPVQDRHDVDVLQRGLDFDLALHSVGTEPVAGMLEDDILVVCLSDRPIHFCLTTDLEGSRGEPLASARPSSASARRTTPDRQRGLELRRHLRRAHSTHGCQRGKCSFAPAIVLDPCHVARCRGSVDSKLVP
jgi:hypothetical protein